MTLLLVQVEIDKKCSKNRTTLTGAFKLEKRCCAQISTIYITQTRINDTEILMLKANI